MMRIQFFTVQGKRKENEDYILSEEIDECNSIHIVADGMGGYEYGRLAAETVANYVASFLSKNLNIENKYNLLKEAIYGANSEIIKLQSSYNTKMGTTIGGVFKCDSDIYAFWVGDVKIIQISEGKVVFESRDHSLINKLKTSGVIPSDIQLGKIRHIVTKSVQGKNDSFEPDVVMLKFKPGDRIFVCSDGILERINIQALSMDFNFLNEEVKHMENRDNSSLIFIDL